MKIINVVGARPNFMKIAPLMRAYRAYPWITPLLVHTGQHYDERMSDLFFRQLEIPQPDLNLGIGSCTRMQQIALIMQAFEGVVEREKPDAVLVVGDVNSTLACGLVAVDAGVRLVHVEAGLRSWDRTMPEEINRILTDSISDRLFCTEQAGVTNLFAEGIAAEKIHLVGNVMVDTLIQNSARADQNTILAELGLQEQGYAVLTLHRPSNVDHPDEFGKILTALDQIQHELPILFPVHPHTRVCLAVGELGKRLEAMKNIRVMEPVGYFEFIRLMKGARLVIPGGYRRRQPSCGSPV
jgi:UDP-N-acetylglucosamine 2-epimerase (non-hydrolysing)